MDIFKLNEIVLIKDFDGEEFNVTGKVILVGDNNAYRVSNKDLPFMGTINKWFFADELAKIIIPETEKMNDKYQEGYDEGYSTGYDDGYDEGSNDSCNLD